MTSDSDSIKDIDSLDIYKKALDNLGEFLEPSKLVQSDLQNVQNQSEVSDESKIISKSSNDKKPKTSEFEEIFNRLLVIFTARDRVQKSLLSNVLENPSTVEIEIHQLDKQLRNNLKTINSKIKPKIKFDIMSSLAEFKAQRTVSSNDWWWNYQLNLGWRYWRIWRWRYWRIWRWLPFLCLGFSAVILYKIIYGLTTGQILIQVSSINSGVTVLFTAIGTILGFVGLQDLISGRIKDFALSRWKDVNQPNLFREKVSINHNPLTLFFKPSFLSLCAFIFLSMILPGIFNALAVNKSWNQGTTFQQVKNDLDRAAYLNTGNATIRKNLAKFYLYDGDYENAAKEYKLLLPDFEATIELLRLHLLKLDKDKNKDHNDYTAYLAYVLNSSYFSGYCNKNKKIEDINKGNSWLKFLATETAESTINGCKLGNYSDNYMELDENHDAYLIFLRRAFEFLKTRGHINLIQGQYYQANLSLESAQNLAEKTIKTIRQQMTEDADDLITKQDLVIRSNKSNTARCILGTNGLIRLTPNFIQSLIKETFCNDKSKELMNSEKILKDTDRLIAIWERRKAESACLLVQSLNKLKSTKKDEKNRLSYEKKCYDYSPQYLDDWTEWRYEYSRWYKPNWFK
jgi:hypothetical protein